MRHCQNCDRDYSDNYFRKHCRTNIHLKKAFVPKRVLLKYYDKDEMINIEFNFLSNIEDMSFNYYLLQPKPMLETLLIKNLDKYPEKLKILEYSKAPYYEYLILKYYGFCGIACDNRLVFCVTDGWLKKTPTEPNNDFKDILRNR